MLVEIWLLTKIFQLMDRSVVGFYVVSLEKGELKLDGNPKWHVR